MSHTYNYIEERTGNILKKWDMFHPGFDIYKLAAKLNIKVVPKALPEEISGLFILSREQPIISFNKLQKNKQRRRFTIAHEIGHYFLHSKEKSVFVDKSPKVLFRNIASSSGEILCEREANAFAAALLMPKGLVFQEIGSSPEKTDDIVKYLSNRFKVSEQAMTFRLANLGYDIGLY